LVVTGLESVKDGFQPSLFAPHHCQTVPIDLVYAAGCLDFHLPVFQIEGDQGEKPQKKDIA
jgi:hypothetical protein